MVIMNEAVEEKNKFQLQSGVKSVTEILINSYGNLLGGFIRKVDMTIEDAGFWLNCMNMTRLKVKIKEMLLGGNIY